MGTQYYIRIRGRVQGPFDDEKLRSLAQRGQFSRIHEISEDGVHWRSAREQPSLFTAEATPVGSNDDTASASSSSPVRPEKVASGSVRNDGWYYQSGGQPQGPVDFVSLHELLASNRLSPDVEVWREGMVNWTAANLVPGLLPGGAAVVQRTDRDSGSKAELQVDQATIRALSNARAWVMFIAVLGFIHVAMSIFSAIVLLTYGPRISPQPVVMQGILGLLWAGVVFYGSLLLMRHAVAIADVTRSAKPAHLVRALSILAAFWTYIGIVMIVVVVLIILALVVVISFEQL